MFILRLIFLFLVCGCLGILNFQIFPARKLCSVKILAGFLVRISFSSEINVTKVLVFLVSFDSHSILDILFGTHGHSDGHPGPSKKLFPAFRLEYVVSCLGVPRSPLYDPESAIGLIKRPCLPSQDSPRVGPGLRPGLGPGLGPGQIGRAHV